MNNSWKLGLGAALLGSLAFAGCSSGNGGDDDDDSNGTSGSGNGQSGNVSISGGPSGTSGALNGTSGTPSGTSGTPNNAGGSGGGIPTAGASGKGGGGSGGGGAPAGGAPAAGAGGTPAGGAGAGGAGAGGAGAGGAGAGGTAAGAGGVGGACTETAVGGAAPAGTGVETAVVLIDNVTVLNGATMVKTWSFTTADDIMDKVVGDVGDKWVRPPFDTAADNLAYSSEFSHNVFAKCDGKPAGSLMAVVPFQKVSQWFKLSIGFATADWSGYKISADVKLVSGGNATGACKANVALFVQDGSPAVTGTPTQLTLGEWKTVTFTVPASTMVDHLSFNISDYTCP